MVGLGATMLLAPGHAGAQGTTTGVRLIHGLRGVVADVYLDDELVLETFQPERSTDPVVLEPGDHQIEARVAGSSASSSPMLSARVSLNSGEVKSAVLHLSAAGEPTVSQFLHDNSPVPAGQTRVIVRHTAAAPAIDVRLGEATVVANLANPGEVVSQLAAGTYQVSVTQAGTTAALAPADTVPLVEGTANEMYLIGDQGAGTLGWIAVQVEGLQSAPSQIATGDSGLAASSNERAPWPGWLIGVPAVALLGAGLVRRSLRSA